MQLAAFVDILGEGAVLDVLGHHNYLFTKCLGLCIALPLRGHHHFAVHFIPVVLQHFNFGLAAEELVPNFLLHELDLAAERANFHPNAF